MNTDSKTRLGRAFFFGKGIRPSKTEAVVLYTRAVKQGLSETQFCLAIAVLEKEGIRKENPEAIYWLTKAAEQGAALAEYTLAYFHWYGVGTAANTSKAVAWLVEASEHDLPEAQSWLGQLLFWGDAVTEDKLMAFILYNKAAAQGFADAQLLLGYEYLLGESVLEDITKAIELCTKAADQGQVDAQNLLGYVYDQGSIVPKDKSESIEMYIKAANQGHEGAKNQLKRTVLIGDTEEIWVELFTEVIQDEYKVMCSPTVLSSGYASQLMEIANSTAIDLFIIRYNNIIFPSGNMPPSDRRKQAFQLISDLKSRFNMPLIVFGPDLKYSDRIKAAGADDYFISPLSIEDFRQGLRSVVSIKRDG